MYFTSYTRFPSPPSSTTSSPTNSITSIYSLPPTFLGGNNTNGGGQLDAPSCAYPSWPRRASLTTSRASSSLISTISSCMDGSCINQEYMASPATSYISDDDLSLPDLLFSDSDEDYSPATSPRMRPVSSTGLTTIQTPIGSVHASAMRDLCLLGGEVANAPAMEEDQQATLIPEMYCRPRLGERMRKSTSSTSSSTSKKGGNVVVVVGEAQSRGRRRRRSSRKSVVVGEKLSPILEGGE